jgi:hypothetical protein
MFLAPLLDNLWSGDPNQPVQFNRKEIVVAPHKEISGVKKKADGIIYIKNIKIILGLLESELPNDLPHIQQDKSKLARCLRSCLMKSIQQFPLLAGKILSSVPFFGIQTHGTVVW